MFPFSYIRCWTVRLALLALLPVSAWSQGTHTTNFPLAENPISEKGNWINGGAVGLNWTNVYTTTGMAMGTMPGNASGNAGYADSTAVLAGTWGPTQMAQATISVTHAPSSSSVYQEVELRLRTTIAARSITGYEINCSLSTNPHNYYLQIVRWNGPLGSFTYLGSASVHAVNGDVLKATISGGTITAYLNGAQMAQATDNTYPGGSPGMGFFVQGTTGVNASFGFTNFTATDQQTPASPAALRVVQ